MFVSDLSQSVVTPWSRQSLTSVGGVRLWLDCISEVWVSLDVFGRLSLPLNGVAISLVVSVFQLPWWRSGEVRSAL